MKKNLYYRTMFRRSNIIKETTLSLFFSLCSYPRLLLEVFTRKNFGERYFSFMTACIIMVILTFFPLIINNGIRLSYWRNEMHISFDSFDLGGFLAHYLTWYVFLAAFLYMVLERREEIKHLPSVFDFARFSLSTGEINPNILFFQWGVKSMNIRTIETLVEPALFFFIGIFLHVCSQPVGTLITICSVIYSISYVAAYTQGDHFIMDKIDEMICNQETVSAFVEGRNTSETRGVNFYGRRPTDPETRRQVADSFMEDFVEITDAK